MTDNTTPYLSLKLATARKTGQRATGNITYRVLCDEARQQLFVTITSNDGGGYFSREIVPFAGIEKCVARFVDNKPLPARMLRDAFVGKSVNNAGFLAAMLRAEGLLAPVPDAVHQHQVAGDWTDWKETMLCLDGEVYVPPGKPESTSATKKAECAPSEANETDNAGPDNVEPDSVETERDDAGEAAAEEPDTRRRKGRGKGRTAGAAQEEESDDARPA